MVRVNEEDIFSALTALYKQCLGGYACIAMIAGFGLIAFRVNTSNMNFAYTTLGS